AARVIAALTGELAARAADSGTRIRIVQALVELPEAVAREVREVLDGLARDDDPALALVASAFVAVLDERSAGE
ncbi:MerR family transcriptional regulator, partial [Streptomyces sp. SID9913]|nr:MerR family transcriptional regulator [Streptomyces sp. SID9913]